MTTLGGIAHEARHGRRLRNERLLVAHNCFLKVPGGVGKVRAQEQRQQRRQRVPLHDRELGSKCGSRPNSAAPQARKWKGAVRHAHTAAQPAPSAHTFIS
jgi:hypothetical protein